MPRAGGSEYSALIEHLRKECYTERPARNQAVASQAFVPCDFLGLLEQYCKNRELNRDTFGACAHHTREYLHFFLAASGWHRGLAPYNSRDEPFREINRDIDEWTNGGTANRSWQSFSKFVQNEPWRIARSEMVADILVEICRQLVRGGVFPVPACGENREPVIERIKKIASPERSPTPIVVEFAQAVFSHPGLVVPWRKNSDLVVVKRNGRDKRKPADESFGWMPNFEAEGWKWAWVVDDENEGGNVSTWSDRRKQLITFASFRDFYSRHSCQVVGAYTRRSSGANWSDCYNYLTEKGKEPSDDDEPDFASAKWRYQHDYGCSRNSRDAAHGYLTLAFSVPIGNFAAESDCCEGIPSYAVYVTLDFLGELPGQATTLNAIADRLHNHISDMRLIATRQLARERLHAEAALRKEAERYRKGYEQLSNELDALTHGLAIASNSLWRVTSIVSSNASLLYKRAATLGDFFHQGAEIRCGGVTIPTVHNLSDFDETTKISAWCAGIILKAFAVQFDQFDQNKAPMDDDELWASAAKKFSDESSDFAISFKALFFPSLKEMGLPASAPNKSSANYSALLEAYIRMKSVLYAPFKPGGVSEQELTFLDIASAFPARAWDEAIEKIVQMPSQGLARPSAVERKMFQSVQDLARPPAVERKIFQGVTALGRLSDLMSFVADLWAFAESKKATKVRLEHGKDPPAIRMIFTAPTAIFAFFNENEHILRDVVVRSINAHRFGGYVARGDLVAPFFSLLSTTLPAGLRDMRIGTKDPEFSERGILELGATKLTVKGSCLRIVNEETTAALSVLFDQSNCKIVFGE